MMQDLSEQQPLGGETALVVFSGGQDSATCLAWSLARFGRVLTLGFDYGQRHRVELDCRRRGPRCARRPFAPLGRTPGGGCAADAGYLPRIRAKRPDACGNGNGCRPPGRDRRRRSAQYLRAGAVTCCSAFRRPSGRTRRTYATWCSASARAIPPATPTAGTTASRRSSLPSIWAWTPITSSIRRSCGWDKCGAWQLAEQLGGAALVDAIVEESHTCYAGERGVRHDWGYGCGQCPALPPAGPRLCRLQGRLRGQLAAGDAPVPERRRLRRRRRRARLPASSFP